MVRRVDGTQGFQPSREPGKSSKAATVAGRVKHMNPNHSGSLAGRVSVGNPDKKKFSGGFS